MASNLDSHIKKLPGTKLGFQLYLQQTQYIQDQERTFAIRADTWQRLEKPQIEDKPIIKPSTLHFPSIMKQHILNVVFEYWYEVDQLTTPGPDKMIPRQRSAFINVLQFSFGNTDMFMLFNINLRLLFPLFVGQCINDARNWSKYY